MGVDTSRNDLRSRLLALSRGFMQSRIFLTALELGLFERLAGQRRTSSDMAKLLNTDERATDLLLNAMAAMGLLEKEDAYFVNVNGVRELLSPGGFSQEGGGFLHAISLWDAWSRLTEIVQTGVPFDRKWSRELEEDYALAMREYAHGPAEALARLVDCSHVSTMLDLGGGAGTYAVAFARRYPHLKVVLFEKSEQALQIAARDVEWHHLHDQVSLRRGDFFADDLGDGYDVGVLSYILCLFREDENLALLSRVKAALADGGRVVIRDSMVDDSMVRPLSAAVFSVHMLVTSRQGRSYPSTEIKHWLRSVGFQDVHSVPQNPPDVVIGRK